MADEEFPNSRAAWRERLHPNDAQSVETALKAHAGVADAAVIGRPDPVHTEVVVAFIVGKNPEESGEALINELRTYCRQHLAPYEVPAVFEFIDAIPRSALGKVLKHELRSQPPAPPQEPEPEKPQPVKPNKPKKLKEAA